MWRTLHSSSFCTVLGLFSMGKHSFTSLVIAFCNRRQQYWHLFVIPTLPVCIPLRPLIGSAAIQAYTSFSYWQVNPVSTGCLQFLRPSDPPPTPSSFVLLRKQQKTMHFCISTARQLCEVNPGGPAVTWNKHQTSERRGFCLHLVLTCSSEDDITFGQWGVYLVIPVKHFRGLR